MAKIKNRILSIFLIVSIVFSIPLSVLGAEGLSDTVSLISGDDSIVVYSDEIAIKQHPDNSDYYISSQTLISNLTSRKYSLSYVDENKESTEPKKVEGGYVKAENIRNSDIVYYIPVIYYKGEEINVSSDASVYFSNGGGSKKSIKFGAGGRDEKTAVTVITPPSSGTTVYDRMEYSASSFIGDASKTYTTEFYFYAEGDSVLRVNHTYTPEANRLILWGNDNRVYVNENGQLKDCASLEYAKWHKAAVTYDSAAKKLYVYIDGAKMGGGLPMTGGLTSLKIGIDANSSDGFIAFSNMKYYYGYYYPEKYYNTKLDDVSDLVSFAYNDDGTVTAGLRSAFDGENKRRIGIAQYDRYGRLISFAGSHKDNQTDDTEYHSVTTDFDFNSRTKTKLMTFEDWNNIKPSEPVKKIGNATVFEEDFEDYQNSMTVAEQGNVISTYKDNKNTAMRMKRNDGNSYDFHLTASCSLAYSDYVVFDYDIKILDENSQMRMYVRNGEYISSDIGALEKDGRLTLGSKEVVLEKNRWYNVAIVYDFSNGVKNYYLDRTAVSVNENMPETFVTNSKPELMRFHSNANSNSLDLLVDNVRIYEAYEPRETINAVEKIVDTDSSKTVFASTDYEEKLLKGYSAIHSRSGVMFADGKKTLLTNAPYTDENDVCYVEPTEVCAKLGVEIPDNIPAYENGYVRLDELTELLGMELYTDTEAINSGMNIFGDKAFKKVTGDDLQSLNDYLFYLRPDRKELRKAYSQSEQNAQHPRIQATKSDFDRVRELYKSGENEYINAWAKQVLNYADRLLAMGSFVDYIITDGRLLSECREMIDVAYTLGMAYQLTGNTAYVDRAWTDLKKVSEFANWNPSHHLDPAEMGLGVAIGYDWMYDALTEEQRSVIEEGMYNNLFYDASLSYKTSNSQMSNSATATNNHNIVCNGGIGIAAMAMLDVYPEESYYLLENALRAADLMMYHWAPYGSWYEGANYWELSMQYTAGLISTLETVLGTSFALDKCEGLSTSGTFMLYMQTDNGVFNTGDCDVSWLTDYLYVPEMFWLSNKYNSPQLTSGVLKYRGKTLKNSSDAVLGLLWYDTDITDDNIDLPRDIYYNGDEMVALRNTWDVCDTSSFVGIHGGITAIEHSQLDGGSFVFESRGERWAIDLGCGDYNCIGYWEMSSSVKPNRWQYFRSRAESHNTISINPQRPQPEHNLNSFVEITRFETNESGAIVTADMSSALNNDASSALRGYFYTDERRSLVVRDEIALNDSSEVYWHMMTAADVEINDNYAILTQNGKQLKLEFVAEGGETELYAEEASEVVNNAIEDGELLEDDITETAKRITIKLCGSGDVNITVKLSPCDMEGGSDIEEYNKPINEWSIGD